LRYLARGYERKLPREACGEGEALTWGKKLVRAQVEKGIVVSSTLPGERNFSA
jgi:hypothetical protein